MKFVPVSPINNNPVLNLKLEEFVQQILIDLEKSSIQC